MPRYFFDLNNGGGFVRDCEGREEDSVTAAKQIAINALRGIISGEISEGKAVSRGSFISVRSESEGEVAKVYFEDVVTIEE